MIWLKFLGGFIGSLAAKALEFFAVYRAGQQDQASKDTAAALRESTDAQRIDDRVESLSRDELVARERLRQSGTRPNSL